MESSLPLDQFQQQINDSARDEFAQCIRVLLVKNKCLLAVLFIFTLFVYTLSTFIVKGAEYLLTNEQTSVGIYKILNAFVNMTVTKLTEKNYCPICICTE